MTGMRPSRSRQAAHCCMWNRPSIGRRAACATSAWRCGRASSSRPEQQGLFRRRHRLRGRALPAAACKAWRLAPGDLADRGLRAALVHAAAPPEPGRGGRRYVVVRRLVCCRLPLGDVSPDQRADRGTAGAARGGPCGATRARGPVPPTARPAKSGISRRRHRASTAPNVGSGAARTGNRQRLSAI